MTSISALTSAAAYAPRPVRRNDQDPIAKVADVFGVSTDALKRELSTGKSMNDVATERASPTTT
jgi:hypothetical protein